MCCNQDRLSNQKCRLNRHLRSNYRQLLASNMGQLSGTQTRRCHRLQLRRSDACAPPHLASLGLLDLPGGEGHVGVAHPLLVQLLLRPQQPLQHHRQLALCALCMLRSQDSCIEFARNLKLVCKFTFSKNYSLSLPPAADARGQGDQRRGKRPDLQRRAGRGFSRALGARRSPPPPSRRGAPLQT